MGIQLSPETEAQLAATARRQGISVDELLQRLISERSPMSHPSQPALELPLWHLGSAGDLHRRDIYDDTR